MRGSLRACALLVAISAAAQEAQPPLPAMRITVTLVQVDAVVSTSSGKRVVGLTPDDFELLQDGQPQKITYFSYVPPPPRPDPKSVAELAIPESPAPVTPTRVNRTVALVVDDLALSFEGLVQVRTALRSFVERTMQPGDLVALVRTGGGVAILEQFTTDKRVLLEAIDLLRWSFAGRTGLGNITPLGDEGDSRPRTEMLDYGYNLSALGALRTIEQVVDGMKKLPGRKSVVFFSDGFRMNTTISGAIDKVTDLANRSAVSIYSVDPTGLKAKARELNADIALPEPDPDAPRPPLFPGEDEPVSFGGLIDLATRTGGLYYRNRNDIDQCVREAADDQFGYYLLAYKPAEGTFDKDEKHAKFHRVTLRMRQRGLQVRWKSGFNGLADNPLTYSGLVTQSREQQLLEALASPFAATGLKVRLTSIFYDTKKDGPLVHSLLYFEGNGLTFTQLADGDWHATVDIVSLAYRGVKQPLLQRQRVQEIRISDQVHEHALKDGFVYNIDDRIKEPGMFLMRVVVRDHGSQRIGSASQYVQVPDTRKGRLAMTGITVRLGTPELMSAVGIKTTVSVEGAAEGWTEGGPAMRRYRPGQSMLYGFAIVNPTWKGSPKSMDLTTQVRLFRNGRLTFTGPLHKVSPEGQLDSNLIVSGGALQFGPTLPVGEYLMQVLVTYQYAKKKVAQSVQWIDFEVVNNPAAQASSTH